MPLFVRAKHIAHGAGTKLKHLRKIAVGADVFKLDQEMKLKDVVDLANQIADGDPEIEYAEPDVRMREALIPNDPLYLTWQWNYYDLVGGINLPTAWDKSNGKGVVVAVLDSGYLAHGDLVANLLPGWDMVGNILASNDGIGRDGDASDPGNWAFAGQCGVGWPAVNSNWHGTKVAGVIGAVANNGIGVAGVAHGAKILPVRVVGRCLAFSSDITNGISWSVGAPVTGAPINSAPAKVINISIGEKFSCLESYQAAIDTARNRGAVVIVSSGNDGSDANNATPANCVGVVSVASTNRSGGRSWFSNYGFLLDIAAPGEGIWTTSNTGLTVPVADTFGAVSGTSFSAPQVAGVAALMLSVNPILTPDAVESMLKSTARPFPAPCVGCGTGILNANAAVDRAKKLYVKISPSPINITRPSSTFITTISATPNSLVANGIPPYTYTWTVTSTYPTLTNSTPSASSTTITSRVPLCEHSVGIATVTVKDALGSVATATTDIDFWAKPAVGVICP